MATTPQYNFNVNRQDLDFILKQIKMAEVSTLPDGSIDRARLLAEVGGPGAQVSSAALLPYGLRTVDGTWNRAGVWGCPTSPVPRRCRYEIP